MGNHVLTFSETLQLMAGGVVPSTAETVREIIGIKILYCSHNNTSLIKLRSYSAAGIIITTITPAITDVTAPNASAASIDRAATTPAIAEPIGIPR